MSEAQLIGTPFTALDFVHPVTPIQSFSSLILQSHLYRVNSFLSLSKNHFAFHVVHAIPNIKKSGKVQLNKSNSDMNNSKFFRLCVGGLNKQWMFTREYGAVNNRMFRIWIDSLNITLRELTPASYVDVNW